MRVQLKNIGIVSNSSISLNGLTVITGRNNSGKTTVGKALYSLLDAVSNLSAKARNDRYHYIVDILDDVIEEMDFFRFISRAYDMDDEELKENPLHLSKAILLLFSRDYRHELPRNELEKFAQEVRNELLNLDPVSLSKNKYIQHYSHYIFKKEPSGNKLENVISEQIEKAKNILDNLFLSLEKDPQLFDYARESINQTLLTEFSGQIQPASVDVESSLIEVFDEETCSFRINIVNNKVVKNDEPVFYTTPYKKTYFIDNPFIFEDLPLYRRIYRVPSEFEQDSFLNPNNIVPHNTRLKNVLRSNIQPSVLEQTIIDGSLEKIKYEIDSIIPGSFEFSSNGDYYIRNGKKLKITNLATGSKMFSIIKILLEKGNLNNSTMLILDEPEAHLHPEWQNRFAEMIVLLVKELGVNILLTTHSSNFVLALDAYMRKYEIEHLTNFYRTTFNENEMVDYECINDNMNVIYQDFLQYLSEVKVLRNECLKNTGDKNDS